MRLYLLVVDPRRCLQVETALHWEAEHAHHIQILASCTTTLILRHALSMLEGSQEACMKALSHSARHLLSRQRVWQDV